MRYKISLVLVWLITSQFLNAQGSFPTHCDFNRLIFSTPFWSALLSFFCSFLRSSVFSGEYRIDLLDCTTKAGPIAIPLTADIPFIVLMAIL